MNLFQISLASVLHSPPAQQVALQNNNSLHAESCCQLIKKEKNTEEHHLHHSPHTFPVHFICHLFLRQMCLQSLAEARDDEHVPLGRLAPIQRNTNYIRQKMRGEERWEVSSKAREKTCHHLCVTNLFAASFQTKKILIAQFIPSPSNSFLPLRIDASLLYNYF